MGKGIHQRRCRRAALIVVWSVGVPWAACSSDEDVAGTGPAPRGTPVEIEERASIRLGVLEGDSIQEFDKVVTPFLLADGRLVVPLSGANSIRVFAPNGEFVTSLGRPGAGPGEFRYLMAAWSRGDTIEAFDWQLRRITRFLPDGSIDVVSLRGGPRDMSAVAGPLSDGWVVGGVASTGMGRRDTIVVHRFARDGADLGEIDRVAGFARYKAPGISGPEPLSPRPVLAVNHGQVYVAETLTPRIQVSEPMGTAHEITWEPDKSVSVSEAFQAVVDSAVARSRPERAAWTQQNLDAAPVPEKMSVFWKFIVDDRGFIWVRPFEPLRHAAALGGLGPGGVGPGGRWWILSPEGVKVGFVTVPAELEPLHITSKAVVGIWRDPIGVESVRVHSLRRK